MNLIIAPQSESCPAECAVVFRSSDGLLVHKGDGKLLLAIGIGLFKEVKQLMIACVIMGHHAALKGFLYPCISGDDTRVMGLHALGNRMSEIAMTLSCWFLRA